MSIKQKSCNNRMYGATNTPIDERFNVITFFVSF